MHFMVDGQTLPAHKAKQAAVLKKLGKVMRLLAMLMLAACMQVSARGYSQNITLSVKHASLETVLSEIKKQSGYQFFFSESTLAKSNPVTLEVKDQPIEEVLKKCFEGQPFSYAIVLKTVVVKDKIQESSSIEKPNNGEGPYADKEVYGRVVNNRIEPLPYANVTVKRTKKGTITDANGNFRLKNVLPEDELIISYIGYKNVSILAGDGKDQLDVVMEPAADDLDKVVVQAYGTTSQRLTTSDIGKVTAEEIARQPVMNPLLALQGKIAGLNVVQTNGYASAPVKVELRGRSDINSAFTSDPLYIVDGVPLTVLDVGGNSDYEKGSAGFLQNVTGFTGPAAGQSPLFSINPADIESIEVLKDASATAIYGSRGAKGVILITTKRGKAGKTKLDINIKEGVDKITRFYQLMNTPQYLDMRREAFKNDASSGVAPTRGNAYDLLVWDTTRYTDWQKQIYGGRGNVLDVQTSLSGGNTQNTFRISAGYNNTKNILTVKGADQRGSVSASMSHSSLGNRFNIAFTSGYTVTQSDMVSLPGNMLIPPDAPPIYDSAGNLNYAGWGGNTQTTQARAAYPFANLKIPYTSTTNFLNSNLILSFEPIKGLKFSSSFGYNNAQANQRLITPIAAQDPLKQPTGSSEFGYNNNKNWIIEPQIAYENFSGKGRLSVLVGGSMQDTRTQGVYISGTGFTSDNLIATVSNAPYQSNSQTSGEYKYVALFSRISYSFENKYLVDLNGRRDGSSRFGSGKPFGNFGSIGAAWIFTEEPWLKNKSKFLSFGKLRASYGTTGSDGVGDYQYLTRWTSTGVQPYEGNVSLIPIQHANPNFQWQVNKKMEAAITLGFLQDRINFTVAYYRDRCGNQLMQFPIAMQSGFGYVTANSPALVQNSGLEFSASAKIINNSHFSWSINMNTAINRNKLIAYPNLDQSPFADVFVVGQPLNIVHLLHFTGIDPATGEYMFDDRDHDGQYNVAPGKPNDDSYIHNLAPKFFGGLGMNFHYNGFDLSLFFTFKKQVGQNIINQGNSPGRISNQPAAIVGKEWKNPGDIAMIGPFSTRSIDVVYRRYSDGGYTDASFIRLSNLAFSYTFSPSLIKKAGMTACSIFFNTNNLFVITKYKGLDPETLKFAAMPPSKVLAGGISFSF